MISFWLGRRGKRFFNKECPTLQKCEQKNKPLEGLEDDNITAAALSESQIIRLESDVDAILDDAAVLETTRVCSQLLLHHHT